MISDKEADDAFIVIKLEFVFYSLQEAGWRIEGNGSRGMQ